MWCCYDECLFLDNVWWADRNVWLSLDNKAHKASQWLVELHRLFFTAPYSFFCIFVSPTWLSLSLSLHLFSVSLHSSFSPLKAVWADVDGESQGGAGLVVEQRVGWHHLQVQCVLSGPRHSPSQHQHGTDVIDLLQNTEQTLLSTSLQLEEMISQWVRPVV